MQMRKQFYWLLVLAFPGYAQMQDKIHPEIRFEKQVITDTVYGDNIDMSKYKYIFTFTNTGKEPIIISKVYYSDPDFACEVPREPIVSGRKSSIAICLVQQQLLRNFHKKYKVEYIVGYTSELHSLDLEINRVVLPPKKED